MVVGGKKGREEGRGSQQTNNSTRHQTTNLKYITQVLEDHPLPRGELKGPQTQLTVSCDTLDDSLVLHGSHGHVEGGVPPCLNVARDEFLSEFEFVAKRVPRREQDCGGIDDLERQFPNLLPRSVRTIDLMTPEHSPLPALA